MHTRRNIRFGYSLSSLHIRNFVFIAICNQPQLFPRPCRNASLSYIIPIPDFAIPAAVEANFSVVSDIPESCLGAQPHPERLLSQSQQPELVSNLFLILNGRIVDKVIIVPVIADLLDEQGAGSVLFGYKQMLVQIILVMTQLTYGWLWDVEPPPLFDSVHLFPHLHHLLLHNFRHFTDGKYFLLQVQHFSVLCFELLSQQIVRAFQLAQPLLDPALLAVLLIGLDLRHLPSLPLGWNQQIPTIANHHFLGICMQPLVQISQGILLILEVGLQYLPLIFVATVFGNLDLNVGLSLVARDFKFTVPDSLLEGGRITFG